MSLRSFIPRLWFTRTARASGASAGPAATFAAAWDARPIHLIVAASAILIGVIVAAVWVLLLDLRAQEIAKSKRDLESLSLVLAGQIERSFQSIEIIQNGLLDRMKGLGIASTADLERRMSGEDTYQRLKDQISALPFIDAIVLTGPNGKLINFSRRWPVPAIRPGNAARNRIFSNTTQTFYVGSARHSPVNGTWVLPLARKIEAPNGAFLGSVLGVIRLRYFEQLFQSVARDHDRSISLFSGDGTLVARFPSDETLHGRSFADRGIFKNFLSQGRYGTVEQASVTNGNALLISGRNVPNYPMAVVITKRLDDVLAGWRYAAIYVAGAALGIALMIAIAGFLIARRVTRDVRIQHRRWNAALNNMVQGLSMFDSSGRLIVWNERYIDMFKLPRDAVKPGASLQELFAIRIASGTFNKESLGDPEEYVRNILDQMKQGNQTSAIHRLSDGRVIAVINHPLPDGGWVATHEDITEARHREDFVPPVVRPQSGADVGVRSAELAFPRGQ